MATIREIVDRELAKLSKTKDLRQSGSSTLYHVEKVDDRTFFLTGCVHEHSGYDCLIREIITGFLQRNINFRINSTCHAEEFAKLLHPRVNGSWELVVKTPPSLSRFNPTKKSILLAMWEADFLDPSWVFEMNKAQAIITPSTWGKASFIKNGVVVPIHVIPLGYNPLIFNRYQSTALKPMPFTFGSAAAMGEGGIRKNLLYTIECFQKAFPGIQDVKLKLKIGSKDNIAVNDTRIEITKSHLSESELAEWYRSLDCYVHLSACEGWGMHVTEASACGVPAISTTYSSMADYMSDAVGIVVDHKEIDVNNLFYKGKQCHPIKESVISAMHYAYKNPDGMKDKGEEAAKSVTKYRWKYFHRSLYDILHQYDVL